MAESAANEFGSGLGPSAGGEPEVSGLPATGTSAASAHDQELLRDALRALRNHVNAAGVSRGHVVLPRLSQAQSRALLDYIDTLEADRRG